jgi:hypothetical protein
VYGVPAFLTGIYYSSAFTQPSCNAVGYQVQVGRCSFNEYTYTLFYCDDALYPFQCGVPVAIHDKAAITTGNCQTQAIIPVPVCPDGKLFCAITDGPFPPTSDAFVEWFWASTYNVVGTRAVNTGKLTYMATYEHIISQYNANVLSGGTYINPAGPGTIGGYGIPLFNPSNHNNT